MCPLPSAFLPSLRGDFTVTTRPRPVLRSGEVLIRVSACGVCGGDHVIKDGLLPQASYPRVPGHEVCGTVVELGPGAKRWAVGDIVGRGWAGGHCFHCKSCRAGKFIFCENASITGLNTDGGMAQYMVAGWESLVAVPKGMPAEQAAPLLCAGTTTFNSLRNLNLQPGAWVAVQGVGGLGHLAVQFAVKMGFRVIVLSTSADKEEFARELGAKHFIDTSRVKVVDAIKQVTGGAGVSAVVSTATTGSAMTSVIEALGVHGILLTLGAGADPISVWSGQLIHNNRTVQGWSSGGPNDGEDTLEFAHEFGVKVVTEAFTLQQAGEAYDKMMANKIRYRAVINTQ